MCGCKLFLTIHETGLFVLIFMMLFCRKIVFPESTTLLLMVVFGSVMGSGEELITVHEKEETKAEGSCVTISCTYKSDDANTTLLWFKDSIWDGKKEFIGTIVYSNTKERPQSPGYSSRVNYITGDTTAEFKRKCDLRINDLQKTDSGNYSFRIQGKEKFMSEKVNLTVTDNPCKVNIEPSDAMILLKESDGLRLLCSTSVSCSSYPEWFLQKPGKGPERVTSFHKRITQGKYLQNSKKNIELKLKTSWEDDNLMLSCRPANTQDSCLSRDVHLSVEYAPRDVIAVGSPANVKEGHFVSLSCSSKAHPDAKISWFKNSKITQLVEKGLRNVKREDSGIYYCEAENKLGKVKSNSIPINVQYGPRQVRLVPAVNISNLREGDELKLGCSFRDSYPEVRRFNWYLNSSQLTQSSKTLTISQLGPQHKGSYQCEADNGINRVKSNTLPVSLKYFPYRIKIDGEALVRKGVRTMFKCSADSNPPPNSYIWKKTSKSDSLPLSFSNKTGVLTIDTVTIQHTGTYTCEVSNDMGKREESIKVTVLYPPTKPRLTMKSEGENGVVCITCTVESFPVSKLEVTGPSDIRRMPKNRMNITDSENKVTIYLNIKESDAGVFKCTAMNSEGTNHTEEELLYAPKNVSVRSEGEQTTGEKLTLACSTESKPTTFFYEWKKKTDGEFRTVGKSQKLHFHSLLTTDSGQYICIADNIIGKAESSPINVKVKLDSLSVLYRIIFPIVLLFILIALAIFFTCRKIAKGSPNNSQENLTMTDVADSSRGRTADFYTRDHSTGPVRTHVSSARPTQQVYSEITLAHTKQGCPKQEDKENNSVNYATLDLMGQPELDRRSPKDCTSAIYSKLSKKKQAQNCSEMELHDYENVSSACAPKPRLTNTDWESETSDEDEVHYTAVSCTDKSGLRGSRQSSSSTSSEEDRTQYSDIKT